MTAQITGIQWLVQQDEYPSLKDHTTTAHDATGRRVAQAILPTEGTSRNFGHSHIPSFCGAEHPCQCSTAQ